MIALRALGWQDVLFCWRLASDATVRAQSVDPRPPRVIGHLRWLARRIRSGGSWVILRDQEPAGLLSVAPYRDGHQVSIALVQRHRGRGVGQDALWLLTQQQFRGGDWRPLYARIKPANYPSVTAFAKAGYERIGEEDGLGVYVSYMHRHPSLQAAWRT